MTEEKAELRLAVSEAEEDDEDRLQRSTDIFLSCSCLSRPGPCTAQSLLTEQAEQVFTFLVFCFCLLGVAGELTGLTGGVEQLPMAPPGIRPPDHFLRPGLTEGPGAGSDHRLVFTSSQRPISWQESESEYSASASHILTAEGTRNRGAELDLEEADVGPRPLMVRPELCRRQNTTDCHEASSDCMIQHQACTVGLLASQKYTQTGTS